MTYALYPIRIDNIDKQLYLLVKTIMMIRSAKAYQAYTQDFSDEKLLNIKQLSYQLKSYHAFLVFPSLHKQFILYPQDIVQYPAIIAVYSIKLKAKYIPRREYDYELVSFYTLDYKPDETGMHLEFISHQARDFEDGLPAFFDNTKDLIDSINRLLEFMKKCHFEENDWYKRMQEARRMIIEKEDGIHILHNSGLFDTDALRFALLSSNANEKELNDLILEFTNNLKKFAMFVVNGLYGMTYNHYKISKPPIDRSPKDNHKTNSKEMRWQYRENVLNDMKQQSIYQQVEEAQDFEDKKILREENNSRILRNIVVFAGVMFLLVGALLLAKYSITGSATISIGVVTAILLRNMNRLKGGYVHEDPQPQWFVSSLVFACMFAIFGGLLLCKWLTRYIYMVSNGSITPWVVFLIVFIPMVTLFIYSRKVRKLKTGKNARLYICLMAFTVCLTIAQCGGSLTAASGINHEEWLKSNEELDKSNEEWERNMYCDKIVGKWMLETIVLGVKQVEEEFFSDGTWQRVVADSIACKGEWEYIGNDHIKLRVTWVATETTLNLSDYVQTLKIYLIDENKFICKKGDYYITRNRKKDHI